MKPFILAIACSLFILVSSNAFSQKENNNWLFGMYAGVNFNTEPPTRILDSQLRSVESCSSVSDRNGKVIIASNGCLVWNRFKDIMPNGFGLIAPYPCNEDSTWGNTNTQGVLLLQSPHDDSLYYLFNIKYFQQGQNCCENIYYSIIDLRLDDRKGDIVPGKKNIFLASLPVNEAMAAVRHSNGKDWWLYFKGAHFNGNYRFLITSDSIIGPYTQYLGTIVTKGYFQRFIISEKGDKVCYASRRESSNPSLGHIVDFFSLNRCSGEFYRHEDLTFDADQDTFEFDYASSCVFNSLGTRLYLTGYIHINDSTVKSVIIQYDLTKKVIPNTRRYYNIITPDSFYLGANQLLMKLAPNNKIYIFDPYWGDTQYVNGKYLGVINQPDSLLPNSEIQLFSLFLGPGEHYSFYSLPNTANHDLGSTIGYYRYAAGADQIIHITDSVQLGSVYPTDSLVFLWSPSDGLSCTDCPRPWCSPDTTTTYTLTITKPSIDSTCNNAYDVVKVFVHPDTIVGKGRALANGEQFTLAPNPAKDRVELTWSLQGASKINIIIYDSKGVNQRAVSLNKTAGKLDLSLEGLAEGLYLVNLVADGKVAASKKLMINR